MSLKLTSRISLGRRGARARRAPDFAHSPQAPPSPTKPFPPLTSVLDKFEVNSELAIPRFENNYMKLNTDKCHLLVCWTKYKHIWGKTGNDKIWASNEVKPLDLTIDHKRKFDSHIANISFKTNQILKLLYRMLGLVTLIKSGFFLKHLNVSSSIVFWFGCFVAEQLLIE